VRRAARRGRLQVLADQQAADRAQSLLDLRLVGRTGAQQQALAGGLASSGCMARRTSNTPAPIRTITTIAAAIQLPVDACLRMSFPVVVFR
jgi:hypothetical protein